MCVENATTLSCAHWHADYIVFTLYFGYSRRNKSHCQMPKWRPIQLSRAMGKMSSAGDITEEMPCSILMPLVLPLLDDRIHIATLL